MKLTRILRRFASVSVALLAAVLLASPSAQAQETVCARVKIEIKQQLTLERQAFDAQMNINNALENASLTNVEITVKVTEENGTAVAITTNPNDLSAKFFIKVTSQEAIADISGNGTVAPSTTAVINWLLIPAAGAAGNNPLGKKFLVGATLRYTFGGEVHTLDVSPEIITVKPLPQLTLDYFLTRDVVADDPVTPAIEPVEPFTLGVRVKNTGVGTAKAVKIDSAQPKIVENNQGLAINFRITGSYVQDAPAANTLLIPFGDITAGQSKMGRWIMETTLAGTFTEFSATFSHADELGGALTSILQATNAHLLLRDVRVDLPGRDFIRDFLALDGDVLRVYESEGTDTVVVDQSASSVFGTGANGNYRISLPATAGFVYAKMADPFAGGKLIGNVLRADAKPIPPENIWFSKTKNRNTAQWEYWINVFDANSPGVYDVEIKGATAVAKPPVLQFIPDYVVKEKAQVSFLVEASSPDGKPVTLAASPLPVGARFTDQGGGRAVFDWTPAVGQAGQYLITYSVSDGSLSSSQVALIKVDTDAPPPGPGTPTIESPTAGAEVASLRPTLKVLPGQAGNDPTRTVQFELYDDAGMTLKRYEATLPKVATAGLPTEWTPPDDLADNTNYWWRARAGADSGIFSAWVNGRFFVNLFNDAPDSFNLTTPVAGAEVANPLPTLSLTNSHDRDGDAIVYRFDVYGDTALIQRIAGTSGVPGDLSGTTSWTVDVPLANHATYWWRAAATDARGAVTLTPARPFTVFTGNAAPSAPLVKSPANDGQVATAGQATLEVFNASDADGDALSYSFEIDAVSTFDSANRRVSGPLPEGSTSTAWSVGGLLENVRYYWRAQVFDGRTGSGWTSANFLMNAVNDPPSAPTVRNPGDRAWTATQTPTLEANLSVDPEGASVSYRFEVYRDSALQTRVAEGLSPTTSWLVPVALTDKSTHYWRVRAEDAQGAVSDWSAPATLYVSTAPYVAPSIAVTTPAVPVDGRGGMVTLRYEGSDANIEPTVALYYDTHNTGFAGVRIVDGLRHNSGAVASSYDWDVSTLPVGAYYVYGVIYDAKGVGRAYAPGAVVIPPPVQAGAVNVNAANPLLLTAKARSAAFHAKLARAPLADVVIPLSSNNTGLAQVSPAQLVFTPMNWATAQTVTVTGQDGCVRTGAPSFEIALGRAQTLDPDYISVQGPSVPGVDQTMGNAQLSTDNPLIGICQYRLVERLKVDKSHWDYRYEAMLTNTGVALNGVRAQVLIAQDFTVVQGVLNFGAVGTSETVRSIDTIVLRSTRKYDGANPSIVWGLTTR